MLSLLSLAAAEEATYYVVVYGATPAGITAAIAARREGASVALLEPSPWIGGMVTGGLSRTDYGSAPQVIGGLAREFFERADAFYGDPVKTADKQKEFWFSEPRVAMRAFKDMLAEAKVEVVMNFQLASVRKEADVITRVTSASERRFFGRMFIDASYEGDLMARAGVSYFVGREARDVYGEGLAGFQTPQLRPQTKEFMAKPGTAYVHGTPAKISALGPDGKPLPGVNGQWLMPGQGDHRSQAYNFRVILTDRADNRVPFRKPLNYDPKRYEILRRIITAFPGVRFEKLVYLGAIPNGKYDANASGLVQGTDHVGANVGYPEGDVSTRARIRQDHVDYVQGFFWFLANDPALPDDLRVEAGRWGLAKDEFTDNSNWPYALYVREARRMIGMAVMTQDDCAKNRRKPDSIGMGSFILDSHAVQRLVDKEGNVLDEGNFDVGVRPYQIPYGCIVPKRGQCGNLLVPVCLSASHVAYGSVRMEPQFMILGQAAGIAAFQSLRRGVAVQDVPIKPLQDRLVELRSVLALATASGEVSAASLPGVAQDDEAAVLVGAWQMSGSTQAFDGSYQHDLNANKGLKSAKFSLKIPTSGRYEVRFAYVPFANRATNIPVEVVHADGIARAQVNERVPPPIDGRFVSLGIFDFKSGRPAVITVRNDDTDGYVAVDAVQLIPR